MSDVRNLIRVAETYPPAPPDPPLISASPHGRFEVDSLEKADWVLEVLACSEQRKEQNEALAKEARRRVDEWLATVNAKEEEQTAYLRSSLHAFLARARELILGRKTTRKSRDLPHGTIGYRSTVRKLVYDDENTALEWARAQGLDAGLARVQWALDKDIVKRHCEARGMAPPGAHWEGGEEEFVVKPTPPVLPDVPPVRHLPSTGEK